MPRSKNPAALQTNVFVARKSLEERRRFSPDARLIETEGNVQGERIVMLIDRASKFVDQFVGVSVIGAERTQMGVSIGHVFLTHAVDEGIDGETRLIQLQTKNGRPNPLIEIDLRSSLKILELKTKIRSFKFVQRVFLSPPVDFLWTQKFSHST